MSGLVEFLRDEQGASAVEYGLIVGLIAIAIVAVLVALGPRLDNVYELLNSKLPS